MSPTSPSPTHRKMPSSNKSMTTTTTTSASYISTTTSSVPSYNNNQNNKKQQQQQQEQSKSSLLSWKPVRTIQQSIFYSSSSSFLNDEDYDDIIAINNTNTNTNSNITYVINNKNNTIYCCNWSLQRSWPVIIIRNNTTITKEEEEEQQKQIISTRKRRIGYCTSSCCITNNNNNNNNQKLLIIGGMVENTGEIVSDIIEYNLTTNNTNTITSNMLSPRMYASCVNVKTDDDETELLIVIGGQSQQKQQQQQGSTSSMMTIHTDMEVYNTITNEWILIPIPCSTDGPILGSATTTTVMMNDNNNNNNNKIQLYILGGYNGNTWTRHCYCYEFDNSSDNIEDGTWDTIPDMPNPPIQFGKAITIIKNDNNYIIVIGESNTNNCNNIIMYCYCINTKTWISYNNNNNKECNNNNLITCESISHVNNRYLYVIGKYYDSNNENKIRYGAFSCDLAQLDPKRFGDTTTTTSTSSSTMTTTAEASSITPTNSFTSIDAITVGGTKLRKVKNIKLQGGLSKYTGQMKQTDDGSFIPHGEGLEIWVDEKKQFNTTESKLNSYYRGMYKNGYRDGYGEMFLKLEENQLYIGQFTNGSWHGYGTLTIFKQNNTNNNFHYYGNFYNGVRSGYGRCTFYIQDTHNNNNNNNILKHLCYSGYWENNLANGYGTITDMVTGEIIENRIFNNEDLIG